MGGRRKVILSVDLGTSAVKAALFALDGTLVTMASKGYEVAVPRPAWAEQAVEQWWRAASAVVRQVISGGDHKVEVHAITLAAQMAGVVPVGKDGAALGPALIWMDQRAVEEAGAIAAAFGAFDLYKRTGCRASAVYPAAKILWYRNKEKALFNQARYFLAPKDYLVFRLTGAVLTDPSTAGATQMVSVATRGWDGEILDFIGVEHRCLPAIVPACNVAGTLRTEAAAEWGLPAGIPVVLGAGDGACANIGSGAVEPGDVTVTVGTSGVIRAVSIAPLSDAGARVTSYPFWGNLWMPNGATNSAGAALDWVVRATGVSASNVETEVSKVRAGSEGLFFLPYLQGERSPLWNETVSGAFVGLRLIHTREHLVRAVLEGVAYNLRHVLTVLQENGFTANRVILGGGASRSQLWTRIIAETLGLPASTVELLGGETALGAAVIAAVGLKLQPDLTSAVKQMVKPGWPVQISAEEKEVYRNGFARFRRLSEEAVHMAQDAQLT